MADYGVLDKVLHRIALQATPVAEMSFDMDQRMVKTDPAAIVGLPHVFVSGLARAGTTALLRRLHASGQFRSLTYRDMPFVLAPNLWRRLSGGSRSNMQRSERAHGDGIMVDADSPEGLDEVFWRVHCGDEYLHRDHLEPHEPDEETLQKFVGFVNAVLEAQDEPKSASRYLSKNNNNIIRLESLAAAFPRAVLLVPFRRPLDHSASLMRQHERFVTMQREEPFVAAYMNWLGHHEFGAGHRPFRLSAEPGPTTTPEAGGLAYWLTRWCEAYEWVERTAPPSAVFVCYEDLCADPAVWERIASLVDVDPKTGGTEPFRAGKTASADPRVPADLLERAGALYRRLQDR
jgi:hypothetical protein